MLSYCNQIWPYEASTTRSRTRTYPPARLKLSFQLHHFNSAWISKKRKMQVSFAASLVLSNRGENQIAFNDNMAISLMKLIFNWLPNIHVLTFCTKLASMHTVIGPVSDFLLSLYTYTNRNTTRLDKGKQFVNWIQLASNIFSSRNVFSCKITSVKTFFQGLKNIAVFQWKG